MNLEFIRFPICLFLFIIIVPATASLVDLLHLHRPADQATSTNYGVDVSFPIHHGIHAGLYPHSHQRYQTFIQGCYQKYNQRSCDSTERARLQMNLNQPSTQHNYTAVGFHKTRVPDSIWPAIQSFYAQNKDTEKPENWPAGNTYVNHWVSPTYMVSFEDRQLRAGLQLKNMIWSTVQPIIEAWVGYPVEPTSLYGIRLYKRGAVLATHVDRLPLVSSAIIQVAQILDHHPITNDTIQDWFLEVYDHSGVAHNISMLPGDMVLYESHSVLHGRPFPLIGDSYANIFVHFKPKEHDRLNSEDPRLQTHHAPNSPENQQESPRRKEQNKPLDPFRRRYASFP